MVKLFHLYGTVDKNSVQKNNTYELNTFNDFPSINFFFNTYQVFLVKKKPKLQRLAELSTDNLKLGDNFSDSYYCCFFGKVDSL